MPRPPRNFQEWMNRVDRQLAQVTRAVGTAASAFIVRSDTLRRIEVGDVAPAAPVTGNVWVDTSGASTVVRVWTGTVWK